MTSVMRLDRDGLHEEMSLPSAGQVWWRAAIRARLEASQRVARPFSWLFGDFSGLCRGTRDCCRAAAVVAHAARMGKLESGRVGAWLGLGELVRLLPTLKDLAPLTTTGMLVFLAATACLLLAPLALYFALSDE